MDGQSAMPDIFSSVGASSESSKVDIEQSNVYIICPHRVICGALARLIESSSTLIVAGDGEAFRDILQHPDDGRNPHLILGFFESYEEERNSLLLLDEIRKRFIGVKTVLVTKSVHPESLRTAVQAGVEAILTTDVSAAILMRSIEFVLLGQRLLPAEVAQLLNSPTKPSEPGTTGYALQDAPARLVTGKRATALSQREHEILQRLVNGYSNKTIARELSITEATVKVHVKALLRKTQMTNRTQAAIWALNNGLQGASVGKAAYVHVPPQLLGSSASAIPLPSDSVIKADVPDEAWEARPEPCEARQG